jgi:hypothetical protein
MCKQAAGKVQRRLKDGEISGAGMGEDEEGANKGGDVENKGASKREDEKIKGRD